MIKVTAEKILKFVSLSRPEIKKKKKNIDEKPIKLIQKRIDEKIIHYQKRSANGTKNDLNLKFLFIFWMQ